MSQCKSCCSCATVLNVHSSFDGSIERTLLRQRWTWHFSTSAKGPKRPFWYQLGISTGLFKAFTEVAAVTAATRRCCFPGLLALRSETLPALEPFCGMKQLLLIGVCQYVSFSVLKLHGDNASRFLSQHRYLDSISLQVPRTIPTGFGTLDRRQRSHVFHSKRYFVFLLFSYKENNFTYRDFERTGMAGHLVYSASPEAWRLNYARLNTCIDIIICTLDRSVGESDYRAILLTLS